MKNAPDHKAIESAPDKRHYTPIDMFPELLPPVVPALWPAPNTRASETLEALLKGPQNQADYRHGWRLAAYVQSLKYDGWTIISRLITKPGCRREIAEYRLDRSAPGTAAALKMRQGGAA